MLPQLPQEILIEILVRLQVKSLLRFQAVSRSWNSLIKSKTFIAQHLSRSVRASNSILLRHYDITREREIFTFCFDDGKCLIEDQILEFSINNKGYTYAGACNGLICLFEKSTKYLDIVLWNPCIMTCFQVPFPRFIDMSQTCEVGLGFDLWTDQYKVIRMTYTRMGRVRRQTALEVEVFVLGTSKWRRLVSDAPFMLLYYLDSVPAYLDGAIHWTAYGADYSRIIIVFDVHKEVFRQIEVPNMNHPHNSHLVTVYGESLCLLEFDSMEVGVVFIWVMKRYNVKESWTKLFRINNRGEWTFSRELGFRKNGKLLVLNDGKELVSYDLKEWEG